MHKRQPDKDPFIIVEEESPRVPRRGWAEMIKKVYEVNPMACPRCQGEMHIIAFLTDYAVVDGIICPPQADICRRETTAAAYGLAGILNGR